MNEEAFEEDERYKEATKQAKIAFMFWGFWVLVTLIIGLSMTLTRPLGQVNFILGFPDWVFYSLIVWQIVSLFIMLIVIKMFFKEVPI
ncbi:MAG: DUF997 family protein [Candidatus Methanomethylicia archaeon]